MPAERRLTEYRGLWSRFWRDWQTRRPLRPTGPLLENEVWGILVEHYLTPGRFYHTLDHAVGMVRQVRELRGSVQLGTTPEPDLRTVDFDALELAVWFHDAVYEVGADDNERRSADLAAGAARAMGFAEPQIEQIRDLILQSSHRAPATTFPARLLCDMDLVLLGLPWEQFVAGMELIRRECAPMPRAAEQFEKAVMLRALLDRSAIYQTAMFRERFEERARQNIRRFIES
jgi:predicted metal-dependent HD superfamily phosphohydrolase